MNGHHKSRYSCNYHRHHSSQKSIYHPAFLHPRITGVIALGDYLDESQENPHAKPLSPCSTLMQFTPH